MKEIPSNLNVLTRSDGFTGTREVEEGESNGWKSVQKGTKDSGRDPSAPDFNKAKRTNPFALMRSSEANFP